LIHYEFLRLTALFILDLVDSFARQRGLSGNHPRPFGPVRVLLTARTPVGGTREVLTPPWELIMVRNESGFDLFFGDFKAAGGVRRWPLPDGKYELRVESTYYQAAVLPVDVSRSAPAPNPQPTQLAPGFAYPFPTGTTLLRGSAQLPDGSGEPGVRILTSASGVVPYVTDAAGQWVLVLPVLAQATQVVVAYRRPNKPDQRAAITVTPGATASLPATALEGQVFDGPRGAGGATIRVRVSPIAVPAQTDGRWRYVFAIDQPAAVTDVTAALPDGRQQTVSDVAITPKQTTAVAPFRF
jgi:hypothetical protein